MMVRKLVCAVAILSLSIGLAVAEEIKGSITRIDDKKVTVVTGKKGEKKTTEYDIAQDCKFAKSEKKAKIELPGGVKNEVFQNIPAKKGIPATLNVVEGKVTEIVVTTPKKKKDTN